jgi:hypothetical protein
VSRPPQSGGSPPSQSNSNELATTSPHDELFKQTFQSIEEARSLLASALPKEVAARIDWSTLKNEPTEHVDPHLTKRYGDLHFRALFIGGRAEAFMEVALEHQSSPDPMMTLRMLGIITRRSEALVRERRAARKLRPRSSEPVRVPVVLPVVLYQGQPGRWMPWPHPLRYSELLDVDAETLAVLRPFIPDFEFVLDDLPSQSDEQLAERQLTDPAHLVLWLLRNVGTPGLLTALRENDHTFKSLKRLGRSAKYRGNLLAFYTYLYLTVDVPSEEIHDFAHEHGGNAEEAEMTAAQRLIEQGLEKGLEKGRIEGRAEGRTEGAAATLERQIGLKFGGVDDATRTRLANASAEELALWTDRILSAQSLEELFAD